MGQNIVMTGMILSVMPIGEYDKRITLLTKESGKITAFAKGSRRPNSSLLAATAPFSFGEFEMYAGRSTYNVVRAEISNYFRELTQNLEDTYYGFYFLEFASYFTQENNDEREVLKLLYQSLRAIESDAFNNRLVRCIYELKMLVINGIYPNVFSCQKCGTKENLTAFSVSQSGMLCSNCMKEEKGIKLVESSIYTMQVIVSASISKLYTFGVSDTVLTELEHIMRAYMPCYVEHSFKSAKFLDDDENIFTG